MPRPRIKNALSGEISAAVIEAADVGNIDRPDTRGWIKARYGACSNYHPLPVHFAELFTEWNLLEPAAKTAQLEIEDRAPMEAQFTMIGARLHGGFGNLQRSFGRACEAAVEGGDLEFFRVFTEIYSALGRGDFLPDFECVVLRAWRFLTWAEGDFIVLNAVTGIYEEVSLVAGDFPTKSEMLAYLKLRPEWAKVLASEADPLKKIERVFQKHGLKFERGKAGRPGAKNRPE